MAVQDMRVNSDIGRFAIVPLWLLEAELSSTAIRLFGVMAAKYADRETGTLYPSRKQLAIDIGAKSPRTIDNAIEELTKIGALKVQNRDGHSNQYTVQFIAHPHADNCATLAKNCATGLADNCAPDPSKKLRTEPEGLLEPESIEPELLLRPDYPEWFKTLSQDPRWHGKDPERYIRAIQNEYGGKINLDLEAHSAYEWLQNPKGQRKKVLRGFWRNWLKNAMREPSRNGGQREEPGGDTALDRVKAEAERVRREQAAAATRRINAGGSGLPEVPGIRVDNPTGSPGPP